jgi:rRNA maturation RNase YbeY
MIEFDSLTDFELQEQERLRAWIKDVIIREGYELGELLFVFCEDTYLHKINLEFLKHDTLTDVITFDYNMGKQVNSEIFISVERVEENASDFRVSFEQELHRVMIHGILHLCGYKDESAQEEKTIRAKEDEALQQLQKQFD